MNTNTTYSIVRADNNSSKNSLLTRLILSSLLQLILMLLVCFCWTVVAFATNKLMFFPPSTNSYFLSFTPKEGNQLGFTWLPGNGARRIVVMKQGGGAITNVPQNGIDYNSSVYFGQGQEIGPAGSGEFVVGDGALTILNVLNLIHSTTYSIAIFEYNGTGSSTEYLISGFRVTGTTAAIPVTPVSNVWAPYITGNSITLWWTNGNGSRRLVVAREGSPVNADPVIYTDYHLADFGYGSEIGGGNYVVGEVTGYSSRAQGLKPGTTYHFAVYEFNGELAPVYLIPGTTATFTTAPGPIDPPDNPYFDEIEGNSFRMQWGFHDATRTIVIAKLGSVPNAIPQDGVDYVANSLFGGPGSEIAPGEFVVINESGNAGYVRNLVHSSSYYFKLFSSDGTGTQTVYLTTSYGTGSRSTATVPDTPTGSISPSNVSSTSITLNWTNGSGERRLVVVRQGSAVTGTPANYAKYSANAVFGSGNQVGTGNYVVYSGTGSSVNITNLMPLTTYHFSIFEYNGNNSPVYSINPATGSAITSSNVPVKLINLKATLKNREVLITWTTAQEFNSSHFEILRSKDGNSFEKIGSLNAAGTSDIAREYSFVDANVSSGRYFYRLKQVDSDEKFELSRVLRIDLSKALGIAITPNPIQSKMIIDGADEAVQIELIDPTGKVLRKFQRASDNKYSVTGIIAGSYFVRIVGKNGTEVAKVIIQ